MNSTSNNGYLKAEEFFRDVLQPLAKKLHNTKVPLFFQKKPDNAKETYFVKREKVTMAPVDFEAVACNSPDDLKEALISLWISEGQTELPMMAVAIAKLSESVHYAEEQSSEVSPFIYVMF